MNEELNAAIVRSFLEAFPDSVLLSGYLDHLILMGCKDASIELDPLTLKSRIDSNGAVADDLGRIRMKNLVDIAAFLKLTGWLYHTPQFLIRSSVVKVKPVELNVPEDQKEYFRKAVNESPYLQHLFRGQPL
ncbi:MAG: hypothetical protein ABL958_06810 [Bdellovibrionia bacterium]